FLNAGVGGASMRNWYYMLRDLDPDRSRFDVIVLPLHGYPDLDYVDYPTNADRELDIRYMIGRQRLSDIPRLSASCPSWARRMDVLRESLFEGLVYRRDLREFLRDPPTRE